MKQLIAVLLTIVFLGWCGSALSAEKLEGQTEVSFGISERLRSGVEVSFFGELDVGFRLSSFWREPFIQCNASADLWGGKFSLNSYVEPLDKEDLLLKKLEVMISIWDGAVRLGEIPCDVGVPGNQPSRTPYNLGHMPGWEKTLCIRFENVGDKVVIPGWQVLQNVYEGADLKCAEYASESHAKRAWTAIYNDSARAAVNGFVGVYSVNGRDYRIRSEVDVKTRTAQKLRALRDAVIKYEIQNNLKPGTTSFGFEKMIEEKQLEYSVFEFERFLDHLLRSETGMPGAIAEFVILEGVPTNFDASRKLYKEEDDYEQFVVSWETNRTAELERQRAAIKDKDLEGRAGIGKPLERFRAECPDCQFGDERFYGLKDLDGNVVVPAEYTYLDYWHEKGYFVGTKKSRYGAHRLFDLSGNQLRAFETRARIVGNLIFESPTFSFENCGELVTVYHIDDIHEPILATWFLSVMTEDDNEFWSTSVCNSRGGNSTRQIRIDMTSGNYEYK